jgi:hypothetical protein
MLDRRVNDGTGPVWQRARGRAPAGCERCGGRLAVYRPGTALYACLACLDCGGVAFVELGEPRGGPPAAQPSTP